MLKEQQLDCTETEGCGFGAFVLGVAVLGTVIYGMKKISEFVGEREEPWGEYLSRGHSSVGKNRRGNPDFEIKPVG